MPRQVDQPRPGEQRRIRLVEFVDEEHVLEPLHHRELALVEQKPCSDRDAARAQHSRQLAQVKRGLWLQQEG